MHQIHPAREVDNMLNEMLSKNKHSGVLKEILYFNESNDKNVHMLINIDPLKLKWCDDMCLYSVKNPRIDFSASIRYAESIWSNGYLIDTPLILNVTINNKPTDMLPEDVGVIYGIDGATRLMSIMMCNLYYAYSKGVTLPSEIKALMDVDMTLSFKNIFKWANVNQVNRRKLTEYASIKPKPELVKVPAKLYVDKSVVEVNKIILSVNNLEPFSEKAMIMYVRRMLVDMKMSVGWVMDNISHYRDAVLLLYMGAVEYPIYAELIKDDFDINDVHKRMCGFLYLCKVDLPNDVYKGHLNNIEKLFSNNYIIGLDKYIESYSYVGTDDRLHLSQKASIVNGEVDLKNLLKKKEKKEKKTEVNMIEALKFKGYNMTLTIESMTLKQRTQFIAGQLSTRLREIEKASGTLYADDDDILTMALNPTLYPDTLGKAITLKYLDGYIGGTNPILLFNKDPEYNMRLCVEVKGIVEKLNMIYFMSVKNLKGKKKSENGKQTYLLPPPSLEWRSEVESLYSGFIAHGLKIRSY